MRWLSLPLRGSKGRGKEGKKRGKETRKGKGTIGDRIGVVIW